MTLKKSMSTFTLLASAIAGIVGSGWLLGPMSAARIAGPAAILSWIIAGLLMMVVAASFVILTRAMPINGGTVRFFQHSYGHFAGFSFSWISWLAWVSVSPIETMALLQYCSTYIPGLMTTGNDPVLTTTGILVAMAGVTVMTIINSFGTKTYNRFNAVFLAFKLFIPCATAVLLLSSHFDKHNFVSQGFMPFHVQSIFAALPLAGVIYSFIGFNPAIQMASEAKNPRRAIPIAIFGSLFVCIILYTLVQVAFIGALPSASFLHGWATVNFVGDNGPFAGLLAAFGFVWFVKALYLDALVSPFGTAMVQSMATGRLTYAMSENGYFPSALQKTNRFHMPARAMLLNMIVGFMFFLPFPSWQHMVGFLVSCLALGYVIGPMALMVLAQTKPHRFGHAPRWAIDLLCFVSFYICNLIIFWTGWSIIAKVSLLFFVGYIILAIKVGLNKAKQQVFELNIVRGSWVIIYMIGMTILSYFSSFGGTHEIPFGIDFIVILVFSAVIYSFARYLTVITKMPKESDLVPPLVVS